MDARQRQSDICQDDENQAPSLYSTIFVFFVSTKQNKKRIGKLAIRVKHLQLLYNYCFFPTGGTQLQHVLALLDYDIKSQVVTTAAHRGCLENGVHVVLSFI